MDEVHSKPDLRGDRVPVAASEAEAPGAARFRAIRCNDDVTGQMAAHLTDTSLCGMESHGLMRTLQCAGQFRSGYITPKAVPRCRATASGAHEVDGGGGIGIPAMNLAFERGMALARETSRDRDIGARHPQCRSYRAAPKREPC